MYGYLTSGASSPIVRWIRAAEDGGPRLAPGQPDVSATECRCKYQENLIKTSSYT
jgi:hypothetical protein